MYVVNKIFTFWRVFKCAPETARWSCVKLSCHGWVRTMSLHFTFKIYHSSSLRLTFSSSLMSSWLDGHLVLYGCVPSEAKCFTTRCQSNCYAHSVPGRRENWTFFGSETWNANVTLEDYLHAYSGNNLFRDFRERFSLKKKLCYCNFCSGSVFYETV